MKVAVIGAGGYAGGELLRLLAQHPDGDRVGRGEPQPGGQAGGRRPSGARCAERRDVSGRRTGRRGRGRDAVFLALEHGESSRLAGEIFAADPGLVVDLAADFRVRDTALYERYYGPHAAPELRRPLRLRTGRHLRCVAAGRTGDRRPGLLRHGRRSWRCIPWLGLGLAGRRRCTPSPAARAPASAPSPRRTIRRAPTTCSPIGVLGHRHDAEITEQWRRWTGGGGTAPPRLVAHAGPFVRGIYLTLHARLEPGGDAGRHAYRSHLCRAGPSCA